MPGSAGHAQTGSGSIGKMIGASGKKAKFGVIEKFQVDVYWADLLTS